MNPASTKASRSFALASEGAGFSPTCLAGLAVHGWENWLREGETDMIFLSEYGAKIPWRSWKTLGNLPSPAIQFNQLFLATPMHCGWSWVLCGFPFPTSLSDWSKSQCQKSLKFKGCNRACAISHSTACNSPPAWPNSPPSLHAVVTTCFVHLLWKPVRL